METDPNLGELLVGLDPQAVDVEFSDKFVSFKLASGGRLHVPLVHYPSLMGLAAPERSAWKLKHDGRLVHWPAADCTITLRRVMQQPV